MPAIVIFLGYNPAPTPTTSPEQLAALRRRLGWTIKEAAQRLRLDQATWGRWEREGISWERHRLMAVAFIQAQAERPPAIHRGHDRSGDPAAQDSGLSHNAHPKHDR